MKRFHPLTNGTRVATWTRAGSTLMEVLAATLVMSIGVVSLATLFPISVLRSIQASQLTNATNLRYNAEAQIRTVPELLTLAKDWQPAQAYGNGDFVVPTLEFRRKTIKPAVFLATAAGTSGNAEPQWNTNNNAITNDGSMAWRTFELRNYVVDPLGHHLSTRGAINGVRVFGNVGGTNTVFDPSGINTASRSRRRPVYALPGIGMTDERIAASAAVLPDSWVLQGESLTLSNLTATSVDLQGVDANKLQTSVITTATDPVPDRIMLIDDTGRRGQTRTITGVAGTTAQTTISWAAGQAMPAGFVPAKARVESLNRRYAYFLSVRGKNTDVVVVFNRFYGFESEQVHPCIFSTEIAPGPDGQPGFAGLDDDGNNNTDDATELGTEGSDDIHRNYAILQYSSTGNKPYYKRGSFICDAINMHWYRVVDVTETLLPTSPITSLTPPGGFTNDTVATVGGVTMDRFVRLTLDKPVQDPSIDTETTSGIIGGAICMKGIVEIFPIRPQNPYRE